MFSEKNIQNILCIWHNPNFCGGVKGGLYLCLHTHNYILSLHRLESLRRVEVITSVY